MTISSTLGITVFEEVLNSSSYTIPMNSFRAKGVYLVNILDNTGRVVEYSKNRFKVASLRITASFI